MAIVGQKKGRNARLSDGTHSLSQLMLDQMVISFDMLAKIYAIN